MFPSAQSAYKVIMICIFNTVLFLCTRLRVCLCVKNTLETVQWGLQNSPALSSDKDRSTTNRYLQPCRHANYAHVTLTLFNIRHTKQFVTLPRSWSPRRGEQLHN